VRVAEQVAAGRRNQFQAAELQLLKSF